MHDFTPLPLLHEQFCELPFLFKVISVQFIYKTMESLEFMKFYILRDKIPLLRKARLR